jgi:hypothetical protein
MMTANSARPSHREFDPSDPLSSFVDVLRCVVLHPVVFFAGIPRREGLRNPFLFALICIVIGAVLNAVVGLIGVQSSVQSSEGLLGPLGLRSQSFAGFVASIVILVVIGIIALPVVAGIYQLLVRIVVGSENSGYRATFRVVSYAAVVNLVSWIPIIGLLLSLYSLYLQVVGFREVHETTTGRAILVFVLFLVAAIVVGVLIGMVVAAIFLAQYAL